MKNKKGVFTITKLLVGLLLFVLFTVVLGGAYISMMNEYGVPVSDKYSKYEIRLQNVTDKTTKIGEQYQSGTFTETNTLVLAGSTVYSGIQILINTLGIPLGIISDATADLPFIPKIFITVLIAILTIAFIFGAGALLARWIF